MVARSEGAKVSGEIAQGILTIDYLLGDYLLLCFKVGEVYYQEGKQLLCWHRSAKNCCQFPGRLVAPSTLYGHPSLPGLRFQAAFSVLVQDHVRPTSMLQLALDVG